MTCTTGGSGQIILGESNGKMHFLSLVDGGNIRLQTVPAYHSKITNIHQLKQNSLVVTVGVSEVLLELTLHSLSLLHGEWHCCC